MISVALCTYNGRRHIREQIMSIINQTCPVDEIVICDDGSTDDTIDVVENIKKNYKTDIKIYVNEQNLHPTENFEKAISLCSGNFIFLSDQDDVWTPNKVEKIVDWFRENPDKDAVFTDAMLIDDCGKPLCKNLFGIYFPKKDQKIFNDGFAVELFCMENRATGATMAIRDKLKNPLHLAVGCYYEKKHLLNNEVFHDGILAFLALDGNRLGYINDCLIEYRIHNGQEVGVGDGKAYYRDEVIYHIDTARIARFLLIPMSNKIKDRMNFAIIRNQYILAMFSICVIIANMGKYRQYYGGKFFAFASHDIMAAFRYKTSRLKKYIKSKICM